MLKQALKQALERCFPSTYEKVMAGRIRRIPRAETFSRIYEQNQWGDSESRSGVGSRLDETRAVRAELPRLVRDLKVQTFLDAPCGDLNWMRHVPLGAIDYIGADIVPDLIAENARRFADVGDSTRRRFEVLDLVTMAVPVADLILCRDCLVHLSNANIKKALRNIAASGSKYLLTTTFVDTREHSDIIIGWHALNLQLPPFSLPPPLELIDEMSSEQTDKRLGLWDLDHVRGSLRLG